MDGNHEEYVKSKTPDIYVRLNEALADLGAVHVENEIVSFTVKSGALVNLCGINKHYFWGDEELALMGALRKMDGVIVLACRYSESVI